MGRNATLEDAFRQHLAWTSDEPLGLVVKRAEGPFIHLDDGRRLTDLISGIAVSSVGHRHPKVLAAVREQLDRHLHVMVYGELIQHPQVAYAKALTEVLPEPLDCVYFTMTGTEANEGALKLAKKATGRSKLVAFEHSYHGDTHGSLSVTGRNVYQDPFRPLLPEVTFLPFGDIGALDAIDETTACVITEPIQGEGGMRVPPDGWLSALRQRCTDTGSLLILDEIQTGFGRTGHWFAFQNEGVVPDILTLAKAMAGGMPLGAFVASAKTMRTLRRDPPLSHVTTFGGHPVSCAAALATLEVLRTEQLPARARRIGARIRESLRHRLIIEIRGRGAMLGMELRNERVAAQVVQNCLNRGVLLGWTLHSGRVIRIAPPLNIESDILDEALSHIMAALNMVPRD